MYFLMLSILILSFNSCSVKATPPNSGENSIPPSSNLSSISSWDLSEIAPNSSRTTRDLFLDKENNSIYVAFRNSSRVYIYEVINNTTFVFVSQVNGVSKLLDLKVFNNQIYISYIDNSPAREIFIKMYNGNTWISPGNNIDIFNGITAANIEVYNSKIYIAYIDSSKKAQLARLQNNIWTIQGVANPLLVRRSAGNIQLSFHNNIPYMFIARDYSRLPVVLRLKNNSWENIFGLAPSGTLPMDSDFNLQISKNGKIYISYLNSIALLDGEFRMLSYNKGVWTPEENLTQQKVHGQQIKLYKDQLFTAFGKLIQFDLGYKEGAVVFNKIDNSSYIEFPKFNNITGTQTGKYPQILINNDTIHAVFINSSGLVLATSRFK